MFMLIMLNAIFLCRDRIEIYILENVENNSRGNARNDNNYELHTTLSIYLINYVQLK